VCQLIHLVSQLFNLFFRPIQLFLQAFAFIPQRAFNFNLICEAGAPSPQLTVCIPDFFHRSKLVIQVADNTSISIAFFKLINRI